MPEAAAAARVCRLARYDSRHMRTRPPALVPLFRSELQGKLLAALFEHPENEAAISDLARRLDAPVATVHREIARLERSGIVRTRFLGRSRLVQPDPTSPIAEELAALVRKIYGPPAVIAELLNGVDGVEAAFIFGSWADRFLGVPGPPPADIDVLVLGHPSRDDVFAAAEAAGQRLGIEVQIVARELGAWTDDADGFLAGVRSGPLVPLEIGTG